MLKQGEDADKHSIEQIRKRYKKRLRQQELQALFAVIRNKMLEVQNNQNQSKEEIEPPPLLPHPLPDNYFQHLSYAMRFIPLQKYPHFNHPIQNPSSSALPILPQIDENIYFQKNGIIVYKNLLGKGTYAHVWEGKVKETGQKVAAKQVDKLQENQRKCLQELKSQHVVRVIDIFTHMSKSFIILEFCDKNLRKQLEDCKFQLQMALKYFEELVIGMDVLQSKNVIHRDLKFENILVKSSKIKIADFGLAKCLGSELQVESRRCGTPYTMAPEIYFSLSRIACYTIKSDLWSIGVILHEMLYRVHPFQGNIYNFKKEKRAPIIKKFGILDKIIDECLIFNPLLRINWAQFKTLFDYYLQEKQYYFSPNQKSSISYSFRKNQLRAGKYHNDSKLQAIRIANQIKNTRQKYRNVLRQRQQSRDRREDRTPIRRKKDTPQKKIIDNDKFQFPYQRNRRYYHQNAHRKKQVPKDNIKQKQPGHPPSCQKAQVIDFRQQEQRPLNNQNKPIHKQRLMNEEQLKPTLRMWQQLIALAIVLFVVLYVSFD